MEFYICLDRFVYCVDVVFILSFFFLSLFATVQYSRCIPSEWLCNTKTTNANDARRQEAGVAGAEPDADYSQGFRRLRHEGIVYFSSFVF